MKERLLSKIMRTYKAIGKLCWSINYFLWDERQRNYVYKIKRLQWSTKDTCLYRIGDYFHQKGNKLRYKIETDPNFDFLKLWY